MNRLLEQYNKEVAPALMKQFSYPNRMAVPKIKKVVINVGTGKLAKEAKTLEHIKNDIAKLTGQVPAERKARKSIAGFKLREGSPVGYVATLRGGRMYDFIDRLISIALPRSRDFRGLSETAVDTQGNLNIGIPEHNIFPEITYETLKDIFGLQVTVDTTAKTREEGEALLRGLGFPLQKKEDK